MKFSDKIASEYYSDIKSFRVAMSFIADNEHKLLGTMTPAEAKEYIHQHRDTRYSESELVKPEYRKERGVDVNGKQPLHPMPKNLDRSYLKNNPGQVTGIPVQDSVVKSLKSPTEESKKDTSSFHQFTNRDPSTGEETEIGKKLSVVNNSLDFSKSRKMNIPDEASAKSFLEGKSYSIVSFGPNPKEKAYLKSIGGDYDSEAFGIGESELSNRIGQNAQYMIDKLSEIEDVEIYPIYGKYDDNEISYAVVYGDSHKDASSNHIMVSHDGAPTAMDKVDAIAKDMRQDSVLHVVNKDGVQNNIIRHTYQKSIPVMQSDGSVKEMPGGRECRGKGIQYLPSDSENYLSRLVYGEKSSGTGNTLGWQNDISDCFQYMWREGQPLSMDEYNEFMSKVKTSYFGKKD